MYISQLFEAEEPSSVLVIYPGRFQPWHKGHKAVYEHLLRLFGRDNVFIATSNKVDPPRSPFSFGEKIQFMQLTGVPMDRVVETKDPYRALEIVQSYNPRTTRLIFAVSEKDMAEDPRFKFGYKKDGSPTYLQAMPKNPAEMQPFEQHGYVMTVPTFQFTVLGEPMRSATEVRRQFAEADDATQKNIIKDLFGRYSPEIHSLMKHKITLNEANINQQLSKYNPETNSYRGASNRIPNSTTVSPTDITAKAKQVYKYSHQDLGFSSEQDPHDELEKNVNREWMAKLIKSALKNKTLTPDMREVLNYRFWHDLTLEQIAAKMGISVSRANQIEANALRKLKLSSASAVLHKGLGIREGQVIPFRRPGALTWEQLPKDVLLLANEWYWASEDDSGLAAVMDPKGIGSGTKNAVQYAAAKLQQKGWSIDFNDEYDKPGEYNLRLTNKRGQTVLLPLEDAQEFKGWAAGTSDLNEDPYEYMPPGAGASQTRAVQNKIQSTDPNRNKFIWKKPNQIGGSFTDQQLLDLGFKRSQYDSWGGTQAMWNRLLGIKEQLNRPTPTAQEIIQKHRISPEELVAQLKLGVKVELEHTKDARTAYEIALDHLNERPDYYTALTRAGLEEDAAGVGVIAQNKKMAKDPRYSMSMTQDVKPGQDKKNLKAWRLIK